ncbi:unnamed protein product [Closterium sp. NIES-54]
MCAPHPACSAGRPHTCLRACLHTVLLPFFPSPISVLPSPFFLPFLPSPIFHSSPHSSLIPPPHLIPSSSPVPPLTHLPFFLSPFSRSFPHSSSIPSPIPPRTISHSSPHHLPFLPSPSPIPPLTISHSSPHLSPIPPPTYPPFLPSPIPHSFPHLFHNPPPLPQKVLGRTGSALARCAGRGEGGGEQVDAPRFRVE